MTADLNYYDMLGIVPSADLDTVKRAYRDQMRRYHPDAFLGKMAKARQVGDLKQIRTLEKEIEESKHKTQQINTAYSVLSDAAKRQTYDMRRAGVPQQRSTPYAPEQDPYRAGPYAARDAHNPTRQTRPPVQSAPPPPNDSFPTLLLTILIGGLLLVVGSVVALMALPAPEDGLPVINDGRVSAQDLQGTTTANQATRIAWTQAAVDPTHTPRSLVQEVQTGDRFADDGNYALAIEMYSNAINDGYTGDDVYTKRGLAYLLSSDSARVSNAVVDFTRAIQQDSANAAAYRGRALAYVTLWRETDDAALPMLIRDDIAQYEVLHGTLDADLAAVLTEIDR